jgi:hypothetical protein
MSFCDGQRLGSLTALLLDENAHLRGALESHGVVEQATVHVRQARQR